MIDARALALGLALFTAGCGTDCDAHGVLCTVAGVPSTSGYNGDGLDALETWLYFPSSLAFSPEGELTIADFNNMRVRRLRDGRLDTVLGNGMHAYATIGAPALDTPLEHPVDIAYLPDGRLAAAELHASRVLVVEPDGTVGVLAGSGEWGHDGDGGPADQAQLAEASGIAIGDDGTIYIADTQNHCIRRVDPTTGTLEHVAGDGLVGLQDGAEPRFFAPQRLLSTPDGLYVADTRNHAIRFLAHGTSQVQTIAGTGIPGDSGEGGPADQAQLDEPYGLAWSPRGTLLIADANNNRIVEVSEDGSLQSLVGTGEPGFARDGAQASEAPLDFPTGLAIEPATGDLFIADMQNGVVRRVRLSW